MSVSAARSSVRVARALFGGALPQTAQALVAGAISPAHAPAVADSTRDLADHLKLEADPVLVDTAGRVDPPRLRQAAAQLVQVADPTAPTARRRGARSGGGGGCHQPGRTWSRSPGCWRPKPVPSCWPPWNRWPAPPTPVTVGPVASAPPMR